MEIKNRIEQTAQKLFEQFPTRFSKKEKERFREEITAQFAALGYSEEQIKINSHNNTMKSDNIVVGNPSAKYIFTAHYDTPGRTGFMLSSSKLVGQVGANIVFMAVFFLIIMAGSFISGSAAADGNALLAGLSVLVGFIMMMVLILSMAIKNKNNRNDNTSGVLGVLDCAARIAQDEKLREQCCFILFDNEEWGLVGSGAHAAWCKKNKINLKNSLVINLDCIGVGDRLVAARTGRRGAQYKVLIEQLRGQGMSITEKKSVMVYMSDHANFKDSTMLCYMRRSALGPLYIPNIHSRKDKECDMALVDDLSVQLVNAVQAMENAVAAQ